MIKRIVLSSFSSLSAFTLIELLVSLVLASILVLGSLTVAARTLVAYNREAQITQMNETARFALDYIGNRIRESGYWGCMKSLGVLQNKSGETYTTEISGESFPSDDEYKTDTLTLLGTDSKGTPARVTAGTTTQITVTDGSSFKLNDIVLIADCTSGDLAKITSITGGNVLNFSSSTPLSTTYGPAAFVYKVESRIFNIQDGANGRLALFETSTAFPNGIELVANIQHINILYGEDTDTDGVANFYRKADSVGNMDNVVSLRIEIVVASENDNMVSTRMTYTFNGHSVIASDNRLYKIYSTTISRRNKGS
ncbi:MAG: prepilin-type N-terminal cleavage/methylation protein [Gammaproteobacteria bacterium]|jgi:type IV pilus assembly protein PilW|nr:prepilin-type N-terminal cleavage/methylation protein [Gammaproteobacteria bacterium]